MLLLSLQCEQDSVEIELTPDSAGSLLHLFQETLAKHKIAIPRHFRPKGPTKLKAVTDD